MKRRVALSRLRVWIGGTAVAALLLGGCGGSDDTDVVGAGSEPSASASPQPKPADMKEAAKTILADYAELIRVAGTRKITTADLEEAQVLADADGVQKYLDTFTKRSKTAKWIHDSLEIGTDLQEVTAQGAEAATIKAKIGWKAKTGDGKEGDTTSGSDPHTITIEQRDGEWIVTKDSVDYFPGGKD